MKNLSLFIFLLSIFAAPTTQCKLEIQTESGAIVEVDENETAAEFFQKYRENKSCTNKKELFLDFHNNRVQENSKLASLQLKEFENGLKSTYGVDAFVRPVDYDFLLDEGLYIGSMLVGFIIGLCWK